MRRPFLFFLLFTLALQLTPASTTAAAEASIGVIVYAEGDGITILRGERQLVLDVGRGEALGEPLLAGDQVTTSEATFAEIQLLTGRNIVRIAENTTFTLDEVRASGDSTLRVTYGRVRARVERVLGSGRFALRGLSAVAGVRGTDFGYDQVLDPVTGALETRIYCFEGEIRIAPAARPDLEATVGEGEMIAASVDARPEEAVVTPIAEPVIRFWSERPFIRSPASAAELLREFPDLPARAEAELGIIPSVLVPELPEEAEQPDQAAAPEQPEPSADPDVRAEPEPREEGRPPADADAEAKEEARADAEAQVRREEIGRTLRMTGGVLTGAGILTDLAAVGLFFYGEQLIPGWTSANNDILGPVAAAGTGVLAGGIISIAIGIMLSN